MIHEGPHRADGPEECFGCKVKSFTLNPYSTPSRLTHRPPRPNLNSWEKGIATDNRGVPILDHAGSPIGVKQYAEQRSLIEQGKRIRNNTRPKE